MENKKYNFLLTPEGAIFIAGWLILGASIFFFLFFDSQHWKNLVSMLLAGHFVGKAASIPIGIGFLHSRFLTAVVVFLQDTISLFIIFPLIVLLKKKIIKNRMIEDTFNQAEELAREHRWIKTFGIVGVAFCVLFPFQPITGPITAAIVGTIISLPSRINLLTVVIANGLSVTMWTYLYGEIFELTKSINRGVVTLISVITIVVLYIVLYFLVIKKRIKKARS